MVHGETLSVDVIKVTIRDKPTCQKRVAEDEVLNQSFEALKEHALRERAARHAKQSELEAKIERRRTLGYFRTWRESAREARRAKTKRKLSHEQRIEQLVCVIAKRQQEQARGPPEVGGARTRGASSRDRCRATSRKLAVQEQRARQVERSRVAEEQQLREIDRQARQSAEQTIRAAKRALRQCDQRTRRSLVHLMREQGCRSADELPGLPEPPEFLQRMEQRAQTRKQRIQQLDELRQRQREEQKRREEFARQQTEEQDRQRQLQALREVQRKRKQLEERRLQRLASERGLELAADLLYRKHLLRRYALEPLSGLLEERRGHLRQADQHYGLTLSARVFVAWKGEWTERRASKLELAVNFDRHTCLWRSFDEWRSFAVDARQKMQVASDFCDLKLQGRFLRALSLLCVDLARLAKEGEARAIAHHSARLLATYFALWRQYARTADDTRGREQRRYEWRDLIQKFSPANKIALRYPAEVSWRFSQ